MTIKPQRFDSIMNLNICKKIFIKKFQISVKTEDDDWKKKLQKIMRC